MKSYSLFKNKKIALLTWQDKPENKVLAHLFFGELLIEDSFVYLVNKEEKWKIPVGYEGKLYPEKVHIKAKAAFRNSDYYILIFIEQNETGLIEMYEERGLRFDDTSLVRIPGANKDVGEFFN